MKPTVWLASYPKSGNTWFRILLANLFSGGDAPVDINRIDSTDTIASGRARFDNHLLIASGLLTSEESDALRPALYAHLASQPLDPDLAEDERGHPVRFVKTHDGYTTTVRGEPMMGGTRAATAALLFVRDPRDVAASLANHQGTSIDRAIALMADPRFSFCEDPRRQHRQLRQQLLGWSGYTASWLDQRDVPVQVIRYEDMLADTAATLVRALAFAGVDADRERVDHAVRCAAIDELQRQEAATGFVEAPPGCAGFFRSGRAGGWRDELTPAQVARIEQDHAAMMRRMGYAAVSMGNDDGG